MKKNALYALNSNRWHWYYIGYRPYTENSIHYLYVRWNSCYFYKLKLFSTKMYRFRPDLEGYNNIRAWGREKNCYGKKQHGVPNNKKDVKNKQCSVNNSPRPLLIWSMYPYYIGVYTFSQKRWCCGGGSAWDSTGQVLFCSIASTINIKRKRPPGTG